MTTTIFFPRTWLLEDCIKWLRDRELFVYSISSPYHCNYEAILPSLPNTYMLLSGVPQYGKTLAMDLANAFVNNYFNK